VILAHGDPPTAEEESREGGEGRQEDEDVKERGEGSFASSESHRSE